MRTEDADDGRRTADKKNKIKLKSKIIQNKKYIKNDATLSRNIYESLQESRRKMFGNCAIYHRPSTRVFTCMSKDFDCVQFFKEIKNALIAFKCDVCDV